MDFIQRLKLSERVATWSSNATRFVVVVVFIEYTLVHLATLIHRQRIQ